MNIPAIMALRTTLEHLDYSQNYDFGQTSYTFAPVVRTEEVLERVFDADNGIFVVAVEGPPTEQNIGRALDLLDLPSRTWRDVRAIAFAGSQIPRPEVCEALAKQSVTVVCDQKATRAVAKAEQYRADALARRQQRDDAQAHMGRRAA
jgi:hypothetical protein